MTDGIYSTRKEQIEALAQELKEPFGLSTVSFRRLLEFGKTCAMLGAAEARDHALKAIRAGSNRATYLDDRVMSDSVLKVLGYEQ